MKDFAWLFDESGNVCKGRKCILEFEDSWGLTSYKVVELAGYRPYYTDGTPDPKNDEVNEWCWIEVDGDVDDSQVSLDKLYPFTTFEQPVSLLYNGYVCKCIGSFENDDDDTFFIVKDGYEFKVYEGYELDEIHSIEDLSEDECRKLASEVGRGSIYLSDYRNSFGIPSYEMSAICDSYYEDLYAKYQEDEVCDTLDAFAHYLFHGEVA